MFTAQLTWLEANRVSHHRLVHDGAVLSYATVLERWANDHDFRHFFTQLLVTSPFPAFRWETPPLAHTTLDLPFEFVLIAAPAFVRRPVDRNAFQAYYTPDDSGDGIVTFTNLGGDATLIVPAPQAEATIYGHLASFVRLAPAHQVDALWRVVGTKVAASVGEQPLWLSTAGGGVAWLHVRLDARPKYYAHRPYQQFTQSRGATDGNELSCGATGTGGH